ncbi:MAG: phosphatase PAP2 family protein [Lachnospiraceae bacterium]|nr:phosphatase PAP2 family protein [Lachnospiraceae bacterium]
MTKETYVNITQPFRDNPKMARGIHMANKICTLSMYLAYPLLILYMFLMRDAYVARVIMVPLDSFIILSVFRYFVNRPRPYEKFELPPVIAKDTKGKSFPSRHVFSAMVIAMTFLLASPWSWLGVLFVVVAVLLAIVRVLSGVHFISDVVAGAGFAIVAAVVGYIVI